MSGRIAENAGCPESISMAWKESAPWMNIRKGRISEKDRISGMYKYGLERVGSLDEYRKGRISGTYKYGLERVGSLDEYPKRPYIRNV